MLTSVGTYSDTEGKTAVAKDVLLLVVTADDVYSHNNNRVIRVRSTPAMFEIKS